MYRMAQTVRRVAVTAQRRGEARAAARKKGGPRPAFVKQCERDSAYQL